MAANANGGAGTDALYGMSLEEIICHCPYLGPKNCKLRIDGQQLKLREDVVKIYGATHLCVCEKEDPSNCRAKKHQCVCAILGTDKCLAPRPVSSEHSKHVCITPDDGGNGGGCMCTYHYPGTIKSAMKT